MVRKTELKSRSISI